MLRTDYSQLNHWVTQTLLNLQLRLQRLWLQQACSHMISAVTQLLPVHVHPERKCPPPGQQRPAAGPVPLPPESGRMPARSPLQASGIERTTEVMASWSCTTRGASGWAPGGITRALPAPPYKPGAQWENTGLL
jgi:hypothetical protein